MRTDDVLMSTDEVQARADLARARADLARARSDLARARLRSVLGLQEAAHVHAGSTSMHSDACTQMHALRCMHSDACNQMHALRCMCTQMHALRCMHSDACTQMRALRCTQWPERTCGARSGPRTCSPGRASRRQMTGGRRRAERRTRPER